MGRWCRVLGVIGVLSAFGSPAGAEALRLGLREAPPYAYRDSEGRLVGLEHDIVTQALRLAGHDPQVQLYSLSRLFVTFRGGAVDAVAPALPVLVGEPAQMSMPYLTYRNVAMSLTQRQLNIVTVHDLAGRYVSAFQNARVVLGAAFAAATQNPSLYEEHSDQRLQVNLLLAGRNDLAVAERRILRYYLAHPLPGVAQMLPGEVTEHEIFQPIDYKVAFHRADLAAAFDRGLAALKASGGYQRLVDQYDAAPTH